MAMNLLYIALLVFATGVRADHANCTALHGYIEITAPANLSKTLFSLEALFGPQTVVPTNSLELVILSSNESYACTTINKSLTGKAVLLWTKEPIVCSYETKVLNAQTAGAAVVLVAHFSSATFEMPRDPNSTNSVIIPSRMLHQRDGLALQNYSTRTNETIFIRLGCAHQNISQAVCVTAPRSHYTLGGEFQFQDNLKTIHPVYMQTGNIPHSIPDMYIFYDKTSFTNAASRWMIGPTRSPNSTRDILAQCRHAGVRLPQNCSEWTVYCGRDHVPCSLTLTVASGVCLRKPSVMCLESEKFWANGEYIQESVNSPLWLRSITQADTHPAQIVHTQSVVCVPFFGCFLTWSGWTIQYGNAHYAECRTSDDRDPSLCKQWLIWNAKTQRFEGDSKMKISNGKCVTNQTVQTTIAPAVMCVLNHELAKHNAVLTTYRRQPQRLNNYEVWLGRPNSIVAPNLQNTIIYLYHGKASHGRWFLSDTKGKEDTSVRGYCYSSMFNPQDCRAAWHFGVIYRPPSGPSVKIYEADQSVELLTGECPFENPVVCVRTPTLTEISGTYQLLFVSGKLPVYQRNVTIIRTRFELYFSESTKQWTFQKIVELNGNKKTDVMANCETPGLSNPISCRLWKSANSSSIPNSISVVPGNVAACAAIKHTTMAPTASPPQKTTTSPPKASSCELSFDLATVYTKNFTTAQLAPVIASAYGIHKDNITKIMYDQSSHKDMVKVKVYAKVDGPCSSVSGRGSPCTAVTNRLTLPVGTKKPLYDCQGNLQAADTKQSSAPAAASSGSSGGMVALIVILSLCGGCCLCCILYSMKSQQKCCFASNNPQRARFASDNEMVLDTKPGGYDMDSVGGYDMDSIVVNPPESRQETLETSVTLGGEPEPPQNAKNDPQDAFPAGPVTDPFQPISETPGNDVAVPTSEENSSAVEDPFAPSATPF